MNYHKLYINQETFNGTTYTPVSPGTNVDTYVSWHVVCQEFPFKYLPEQKEFASRDWPDENGEDVFIPTDGKVFKPYDLEVSFIYVGSPVSMHAELAGFIEYINGMNSGGSPLLAVYDEYTKLGFHGLYVTEVSDDLYDISDVDDAEGIALLKVKFRVTQPTASWNGQV